MGLERVQQGFLNVLSLIYPPRCLSCGGLVESNSGLCVSCWQDTPFIGGLICDMCGTPLPGQSEEIEYCDNCMTDPFSWDKGRAALMYRDVGRQLVLRLKHGDRHDIAGPAGKWMAQRVPGLIIKDPLICPVPLHPIRHISRRFNQAALLSNAVAHELNAEHCPDALQRHKRTQKLDGKTRAERFSHLKGAISVNPKYKNLISERNIVLVDDVMTSGATLSTCSEALVGAGAAQICICVMARVASTA